MSRAEQGWALQGPRARDLPWVLRGYQLAGFSGLEAAGEVEAESRSEEPGYGLFSQWEPHGLLWSGLPQTPASAPRCQRFATTYLLFLTLLSRGS